MEKAKVIDVPLERLKTWHIGRLISYYLNIMNFCPKDNIKLENVCTALGEKTLEERTIQYSILHHKAKVHQQIGRYEIAAKANTVAEYFFEHVISKSL